MFKIIKNLSCVHDIKKAIKRQIDNWNKFNVDDFHFHWRFKKSQIVESIFEFRFDYRVIEKIMTQFVVDLNHSDDDDWMYIFSFVEANDDWNFSNLIDLMKRLNIQFDNVVISSVNESKKKKKKMNFKNNNVIEFVSESIDSIEKELMIKNIFSINEFKIVKVKRKSRDAKNKQSLITRAKKKRRDLRNAIYSNSNMLIVL